MDPVPVALLSSAASGLRSRAAGCDTGACFSAVVQGFASPFQPAAAQLTERIQGQGSWPTFTADPGAEFGGFNVTVYSLQPDCR